MVSVDVYGENDASATHVKTDPHDNVEKQSDSSETHDKPPVTMQASTKRQDEEEDLNQEKKIKLFDAAFDNLKGSKSLINEPFSFTAYITPQHIDKKAGESFPNFSSKASF